MSSWSRLSKKILSNCEQEIKNRTKLNISTTQQVREIEMCLFIFWFIHSKMPLPPALLARLAKRGILNAKNVKALAGKFNWFWNFISNCFWDTEANWLSDKLFLQKEITKKIKKKMKKLLLKITTNRSSKIRRTRVLPSNVLLTKPNHI